MNTDLVNYREYRESDYSFCEALVSDAWSFDSNFRPQALADIGKYLYTMGSVAGSNFRQVAEINGSVVGFIFGYNEKLPLQKHRLQSLSSRFTIFLRLVFMRGFPFNKKRQFLNALSVHEINRTALLKRGASEIILFVVNPLHQGKGIGKQLFYDFRDFCKKNEIPSIIVETNKRGASSFYERVGFQLKGEFDSPLHDYATPNGQACLYEYQFYGTGVSVIDLVKKRKATPTG